MGLSPENADDTEAESVIEDEGNTSMIDMRDHDALSWSKTILRKQSCYRNLGDLMINHETAVVRIGKTLSRSR